ncbi:MAG TPA: hypothetical protein DCY42_13525 [Chloroflexi bacterium]|nr:hypothetical protein [Chloroflexota bacterium]
MDPKLIAKISRRVYTQFPELKGSKPKIKQSKLLASQQTNFVLTYNILSKDIRGHTIPRHVRVVADSTGKILKMSTSR